jgi:hypothetical protein
MARRLSGNLRIAPTEKLPNRLDYTGLYYRIGKDLARLYMDALNRLRWELHPQHAEDAEVIEGFWALFTQVTSNAAAFWDKSNLNKALEDFATKLKRPLSDFEVGYAIESMNIGPDPIPIGSVTFVGPANQSESNWARNTTWFQKSSPTSAAYSRVAAADPSRASESGIQQVSDAMDVLRVTALRGLAGRSADDRLLQWRMSGSWAVRSVSDPSPQVWSGWRLPFIPLSIDLSSVIHSGLRKGPFSEISENTLQPDIQRRLMRAVNWISGSVLHAEHDRKIVDLCTALETMLLPGHRGNRKNELLALRYYLVGGLLNPGAILDLYGLRNDIVHGSALRVVGVLDTWQLRLECDTVLARLLYLAKRTPHIETLEGLIGIRETRENLDEFIRRCEIGTYEGPGIGKLKNFAKSRCK